MWFEIDFRKLVLLLIPTFLRRPRLVAYLQALITPIANLHIDWKKKRLDDWYKINHTGQVCYLQKALNDRFDVSNRQIYITDGNSFPRKYIYTNAEKKPVFLGKIFIYQNGEYSNTGVDFIVHVPKRVLRTQLNEVKALINFYKLASKRFSIQPL